MPLPGCRSNHRKSIIPIIIPGAAEKTSCHRVILTINEIEDSIAWVCPGDSSCRSAAKSSKRSSKGVTKWDLTMVMEYENGQSGSIRV